MPGCVVNQEIEAPQEVVRIERQIRQLQQQGNLPSKLQVIDYPVTITDKKTNKQRTERRYAAFGSHFYNLDVPRSSLVFGINSDVCVAYKLRDHRGESYIPLTPVATVRQLNLKQFSDWGNNKDIKVYYTNADIPSITQSTSSHPAKVLVKRPRPIYAASKKIIASTQKEKTPIHQILMDRPPVVAPQSVEQPKSAITASIEKEPAIAKPARDQENKIGAVLDRLDKIYNQIPTLRYQQIKQIIESHDVVNLTRSGHIEVFELLDDIVLKHYKKRGQFHIALGLILPSGFEYVYDFPVGMQAHLFAQKLGPNTRYDAFMNGTAGKTIPNHYTAISLGTGTGLLEALSINHVIGSDSAFLLIMKNQTPDEIIEAIVDLRRHFKKNNQYYRIILPATVTRVSIYSTNLDEMK